MNCALYNLTSDKPTVKKLLNQLAVVFLASIIIWLAHRRWQRLRDQMKATRYDNGLKVKDMVVIQWNGHTLRGIVSRKRPGYTIISAYTNKEWKQYGLMDTDFKILVMTRTSREGINVTR